MSGILFENVPVLKETCDAIYYPFFFLNETQITNKKSVGCLSFVKFTYANTDIEFVGKIWSVFFDKDTNSAMCEIQIFPYASAHFTNLNNIQHSKHYTELVCTTDCIEVPLKNIVQEVKVVYVKKDVRNLTKFVKENKNKKRIFDDEDSDEDDSDGDDSDDDDQEENNVQNTFFYRFYGSLDSNAQPMYMPDPVFVDDYFSYMSAIDSMNSWYDHEFFAALQVQYLQPILQKLVPSANLDFVFYALNNHTYVVKKLRDAEMLKIVFSQVEHVISFRQLNILKALETEIANLKQHASAGIEDIFWLNDFLTKLNKLFENATI